MNLVKGVDVSVWEPRVDWRTLRAQGIRFALIRATSDVSYTDSLFKSHWEGARQEGILRGAYHYLFAKKPAKEQADHFIRTVGSDRGELPPIIDLEDKYNEDATNKDFINTCLAVLERIKNAFGRTPMVYSRKSFLQPRLTINGKPPAWAKDYLLWVAQYPWEFNPNIMPNKKMPEQPEGWQNWTFWQYSEATTIEGVTDVIGKKTPCDLNWFRGTEAELYEFAKVQPPAAQTYAIQPGDTFKTIADKNNLSLSELLDANPSLVKPGTRLTIPGRVQPPPQPPEPPSKLIRIYVVQNGDTLSVLAEKFGTTQDAIMALNPQIKEPNRWLIKDNKLTIPDGWS